LDPAGRQRLADELEQIDLELLRGLREEGQDEQDWQALAARAHSPPAIRLGDPGNRFTSGEAHVRAEQALRAGQLGAILVAGGQGTRLGFPHPKGMFPIGPVSHRTLFQMHIDQLRATARRYGVRIPLYLMTSPATHAETVDFLEQHDRFGLARDDLRIFCQGTMPAVDLETGHLLLSQRDAVALSPDGHGGTLAALERSGCLEDMRRRGIRQLYYFQVDNPLLTICDRELVGYHLLAESEMTTQVVAKRDPRERVGNVVVVDDRMMVIEYSDLPDDQAERRTDDGGLLFWAGSIAVHVFDVAFLERMAASSSSLPFHRARKKVPFINQEGAVVNPEAPNAVKFEKFIFDLMPAARNAIVVEADEADTFAPLKNASGASKDTPETTRAAIVAQATRWLQAAGARVDPGVAVEVDPLLALDVPQLREVLPPNLHVTQDRYFTTGGE
jgi:UDP-N-acetylglucosamine/UDP-N-acetylgalactosamine diphosphorylase